MLKPGKIYLIFLALLPMDTPAADFSGRISLTTNAGKAHSGDIGDNSKVDILTADQQSLRLMLENSSQTNEWTAHLKTGRLHINGVIDNRFNPSDLFRFEDLSHNWYESRDDDSLTQIGLELDHGFFKHSLEKSSFSLGRQPVDWGSGRFWQPFNVFGAFFPTDLDTEYKPGIDSFKLDWYPAALSSLQAVYAFSPHDRSSIKNSGAVQYKRLVGEKTELALLGGSVVDQYVFGASLESDWKGLGWRFEGVYYNGNSVQNDESFWITGLDYQFDNGTLATLEWYDNSRGANRSSALAVTDPTNPINQFSLQPYQSRRVIGIALNRDITPLLNGNYTMLISPLKDSDNQRKMSILHQINLIYSLGDESELLFSLQHSTGDGLDEQDQIRSEFGHLPTTATLIFRHYF